jgi:hypothetical protein
MSRCRAARTGACAVLAALFACGPTVKEPLPEDWHLGVWFVPDCEDGCSAEILVQLEVEPDGVARIYRESYCAIDTEDPLTWTEEEDGSLRFEPDPPGGSFLLMGQATFLSLRHVDECRAIAEESNNEFFLRRGPVILLPPHYHDCHGPVVPAEDSPYEACLYAE